MHLVAHREVGERQELFLLVAGLVGQDANKTALGPARLPPLKLALQSRPARLPTERWSVLASGAERGPRHLALVGERGDQTGDEIGCVAVGLGAIEILLETTVVNLRMRRDWGSPTSRCRARRTAGRRT